MSTTTIQASGKDVTGTDLGGKHVLDIGVISIPGLVPSNFNAIYQAQTSLTDIWTYYEGAALLATITVTYTTPKKEIIVSVVKT